MLQIDDLISLPQLSALPEALGDKAVPACQTLSLLDDSMASMLPPCNWGHIYRLLHAHLAVQMLLGAFQNISHRLEGMKVAAISVPRKKMLLGGCLSCCTHEMHAGVTSARIANK